MHAIVYALVEGATERDALSKAKAAFDELVESDTNIIDYYATFEEEGLGVAGVDRWGDLPAAAPVNSPDGEILVDSAWKESNDTEKITFHLDEASEENGVVLFDETGTHITDRETLDSFLGHDDSWIVPADVHY